MEETSNCSSRGTSIVEGVKQTLRQLVDHFNQPVHDVLEGGEIDNGDEGNSKKSWRPPPPYFDSLLGGKPELSPTIRFWLDRLSSISTTHPSDETTSAVGIVEWIFGYESSIRPLLLQSAVGCVAMLAQYELILSEWLCRIAKRRSDRMSPDEGVILDLQPSEECSMLIAPSIISLPRLSRSIEILATDITLMTSERLFPKFSVSIRSDIILPMLLRILDRVLETLHVFPGVEYGSTHVLVKNSASGDNHDCCLRRCVVSLLAFDRVHIAPPDVTPSLGCGQPQGGIGSMCYRPPTKWQLQEVQLLNSRYLSFDSIDWDPVTLSGALWNDPNTGIAARAAERVWWQLGSLLMKEEEYGLQVQGEGSSKTNDVESDNHLQQPCLRQAIVRVLGVRHLLDDVRKHFFGRDMISWEPQLHTSQQVVLGRQVTKSRPVVDEKPFHAVPSRIAVALNFLQLVDRTDRVTECSSRDFTEKLFSICATLLDSTSAVFVALGASGMAELVELLDGTLSAVPDGSDRGNTGEDIETSWKSFVDDALSALERAFRTSHDGPVVVAIGQAQSRLLQTLQSRKYSQWDTRRRKITGQWLFRLQRSSHRAATQSQCWELLVAGIVPLLLQHALNETTAADSMEMGRLGLSAILPLIEGQFVDDKTQVMSLVALINLLGGTYPIMPHHGGKILCHLLAAGAAIRDTSKEDSARRKLVVHAAGVALAICGPKFTIPVLNNISNDREHYQETLIEAVMLVREEAATLQHESVEKLQ
jgi:hypothetical protein